jgi:hypothetical protein
MSEMGDEKESAPGLFELSRWCRAGFEPAPFPSVFKGWLRQ